MTCPDPVQLKSWLKGDPSLDWIDAHLDTCEKCRDRLEELDSGIDWAEKALHEVQQLNQEDRFRHQRSNANSLDSMIRRGLLRASADNQYPAELGAYKVLEYVGRGGMGIVLKGYEESLHRTVALKLLRPELADDADLVARFVREARIAAGLRHPNIVTVHAVVEEDGQHFLVMEYIDGTPLSSIIKDHGPIDNDSARATFTQLIDALSAAHEKNLIHRDIKPSNLLIRMPEDSEAVINADGILHLVDFGLARLIDSQTKMTATHSALGTPNYMSPEQARGERELDCRTDLYSAGTVLYEMLSGQPPFSSFTPAGVIHRVLNEPAPDPREFNPDANPQLSDLAMRLMAKRPEDRIQSAPEILEILQQENRVRNLERSRARRRKGLLFAGIAMLLAVAGLLASTLKKPHRISEVRQDFENHSIEVRYDDDPAWKVFWTSPEKWMQTNGVQLLNYEDETQNIAVTCGGADSQKILTLLDSGKNEIWNCSFFPDMQWPDCGESDTRYSWGSGWLLQGNFTPEPGIKLAEFVSLKPCYPSCLLLLDPVKKKMCDEERFFWHSGQLQQIYVLEHYFGQGHPAILALAMNNKLDGFGDPPPRPYVPVEGEDTPLTNLDKVFSIMILDPWNMGGLGPPRNPYIDIEPAYVEDYTWFTLPSEIKYVDEVGKRQQRSPKSIINFQKIVITEIPSSQDGVSDYQFSVHMEFPPDNQRDRMTLMIYNFDKHLGYKRYGPASGIVPELAESAPWEEHWYPLIREGQYVKTGLASDAPHPAGDR